MTNITVYDVEANKIEDICKEYDTTEAEVIEALIEAIEYENIDLGDWL